MQDLNAATIKDVQEFFRMYYAPNNAVLTLVGDFEPAQALAKIKKYFGDIPAGARSTDGSSSIRLLGPTRRMF